MLTFWYFGNGQGKKKCYFLSSRFFILAFSDIRFFYTPLQIDFSCINLCHHTSLFLFDLFRNHRKMRQCCTTINYCCFYILKNLNLPYPLTANHLIIECSQLLHSYPTKPLQMATETFTGRFAQLTTWYRTSHFLTIWWWCIILSSVIIAAAVGFCKKNLNNQFT